MQAFADLVRQGKVLYVGVSEWTADQLRDGAALAKELGFQLISNQPQYSALWRVIEAEVVPTSRELGISQVVWSPIAQGVLTGKYVPGEQPPAGSRATDDKGGANMIARWMRDDVLERVQQLKPLAADAGLSMAALAVAWVLQNDNVATAIIGASRPEQVADNVAAAGVTLPAELLAQDRRGARPGDRARPGQDAGELAEDPRGLTGACKRFGAEASPQKISPPSWTRLMICAPRKSWPRLGSDACPLAHRQLSAGGDDGTRLWKS